MFCRHRFFQSSRILRLFLLKTKYLLEPCGCQNPKPLFRLTIENSATFASLPRFPNHININLKNFSAVAFNSHKYLPLLKNTDKQEVLVELQLNEYKNKKYVKGIAKNIVTGKIKKPSNNDFIKYILKKVAGEK